MLRNRQSNMADERKGKDFAKKQLEKYGWKQGKGLGKEEDGISKAIKVGIKNDTNGVGYDLGEQFTFHWWDHVFNKTAKSLVVEQCEDGVKVSKNDKVAYKSLYNKKPTKHSGTPLLYGRFVKASSTELQPKDSDSDSDEEEAADDQYPEDKLFSACGGRTAHKAARHGFKLNGKLLRLEEHEKQTLSAASSLNNSPAVSDCEGKLHNEAILGKEKEKNIEKKTKKRKKLRETALPSDSAEKSSLKTPGVGCDEEKHAKRKRKEKKGKGIDSRNSDSVGCTANTGLSENDLIPTTQECKADSPKKTKRDRLKLKDREGLPSTEAILKEGVRGNEKKHKKKRAKKKRTRANKED